MAPPITLRLNAKIQRRRKACNHPAKPAADAVATGDVAVTSRAGLATVKAVVTISDARSEPSPCGAGRSGIESDEFMAKLCKTCDRQPRARSGLRAGGPCNQGALRDDDRRVVKEFHF